jgi:hypothetical protein
MGLTGRCLNMAVAGGVNVLSTTRVLPSNAVTRVDLAAALIWGLLTVLAIEIGFVPVNRYSHDLFIPLDGAWRVLNGQRPHADFTTVLGPVYYLVEAMGVALAGTTAKGLAYSNIIASAVLTAWAYLICRKRIRPGAALALTVFTFILSFAPLALGDPDLTWHTYAMVYTRWGVALMCILLVECVVPWETSMAGISTGIVCALLLFLKVNLFVIAAGLVGTSFILLWNGRRVLGIVAGFSLVTLPMLAYLRFDVAAVWRDLTMVATGRGATLSLLQVFSVAKDNWATLAITAGLGAMIGVAAKNRYLIFSVVVFGAGTLLLCTNYQPSGMPLGVAFALICLPDVYAVLKQGQKVKSVLAGALVVWAAAFIVQSMNTDVLSIVHAALTKPGSADPLSAPFQSPAMAGFLTHGPAVAPERPVDGQWLAEYVNDGLALLRENTSPGDSVASLDYVNPFPFALQRPPNLGGAVWLAYGDSFSDRTKPDPARLLGSAAVVMIPKWPTSVRSTFDGTLRIYDPYLKTHFVQAAESRLWILERRNDVK